MDRWITCCIILIFIQLGVALCSDATWVQLILCLLLNDPPCAMCSENEANKHNGEKQPTFSKSISTRQMDVTTPITTIPTINPTPSTTPVLNPAISNPDSPAVTNNPTTTPSATRSWCVASQSAPQTSLQVALDYACGYGGADCSAIQPNGGCYNPNTLHDHASYAFNSYYQKNPVPTSCTFGGTAVTTSTDPSSSTCQYPSTSTSSSILNISNANGGTVFGAGPSNPSSSAAAVPSRSGFFIYATFLIMMLARDC